MTEPTLIARLEAATEGSRELDETIFSAVGGKDPPPAGALWRHTAYSLTAPRYTTSLDAALTLVPEGLFASTRRHPDGRGSAEIWRYSTEMFFPREYLEPRNGSFSHQNIAAATPALALCIAALKAREAANG